jgi:CheY-like chemotaxis protein
MARSLLSRLPLDMVRKLNPDIVVLDLMMPGTNGFEVAREIVATAPHTRNVHCQRL